MKLEKLEKDSYYHIYNRGINGEKLFKNAENKDYFLKLFGKYVSPHVSVLAFCLLENHFHFLLEIKSDDKITTKSFSDFFNAYAKAYNKYAKRTGSLFDKHFKRKKISNETYLKNLLIYIHDNPKKNIEAHPFSSYRDYLENTQPDYFNLTKELPFQLFDSVENMKYVHNQNKGMEVQDLEEKFNVEQKNLQGDLVPRQHLAGKDKHTMKDQFVTYIKKLQDTITSKLEEIDGKATFKEDPWVRKEGGGGRTRVIENGTVFEKGGVNISEVHGELPESMQNYFGVQDANFFACGLSLVLHPKNPFVPTVHANWRYFEMYDQEGNIVDQWFGGGQDLTPYYLFEEDATHFHKVCKTACDKHNPDFYSKYKARCDEYFYNAHREEGRGIGGLFFDHLKKNETMKMEDWYNFVTEVGDSFLEAYVPIVEKRKDLEYTQQNRDWQEIRRGRYVEFNLVHDKGTLFGLKTNGRIESILMSLPPHVQWRYDHQPELGSEEEILIERLKNPKDWV